MLTIDAPTLDEIRAARDRIAGSAIRTPLVRLNVPDASAEIWLKLENLQPIGSFKLRGATNAMGLLSAEQLARGVYTASAGNMAQGVAWNARRLGIPCTVVVPDHAPQTKIDAVERLGAKVVRLEMAARRAGHEVTSVSGTDVLQCLSEPLRQGPLRAARLRLQLRTERRPRDVDLQIPDVMAWDWRRGDRHIRTFLEERGFLVGPAGGASWLAA